MCLGLGSNLGDRARNLRFALLGLEGAGVRIERCSRLYATEPVGGPPQGWFLNAAVRGRFTRSPRALLAVCLDIERSLGRERSATNGPRTVDLDLLFFGDAVVDEPGLRIPHPRLHERRFVLVPLEEIAADWVHPVYRQTVRQLLGRCGDRSAVLPGEPWRAPVGA